MTWSVVRLGTVTSTNDVAAARAREGAHHGWVIVAEEQTHGRGTRERTWASPTGGLYLSVILRPQLPPAALPPLTLAAGVGVCDACRELGIPADLKWPNDVLWHGRKVAGILVEASTRADRVEYVILGVGVNSGSIDLPPDLPAAIVPASTDVALDAVLYHLERAVSQFLKEGPAPMVRAFKERCSRLGRPIRVREGDSIVEGILEDIDASGAIRVAGRRIVSGEIVP